VDLFNKTYYRNPFEVKDTYNTIKFTSEEILHKEKNSKFFGSAYPIQSEDEVKLIIDGLRKKHPNAGHFVMPIK
jgi:putative IMPACT (imprinted ancient) family translation regulator